MKQTQKDNIKNQGIRQDLKVKTLQEKVV